MDISSINNQNLVNLNINVGGAAGATQVSAGMISEQQVLNGFSSEDTMTNLGGASGASSSNGITVIENTTIINISIEAKESLGAASSAVKAGDISGACSHLSNCVNCMIKDGMPVDVNALVQEVLRESYIDTTQDLQFYAEKVKYFNEAKKACREFVQDLRDMKTQVSDQLSKDGICYSDINSENSAKAAEIIQGFFADKNVDCSGKYAKDLGLDKINFGDIKTADDLDNLIQKFEEKLSTLGDDSQLANTDLQNVLQKQQQTIQMMSNISKQLSDTALAIIRKIG